MKKMLILALSLVILGSVMLTLTACMGDWNFQKIMGTVFETKTYEVDKTFDKIDIISDTADITLLPADDGKCNVVSFDRKKIDYTVSVEGDTLKIKVDDKRAWFERLFTPGGATLKVYLPYSEYKTLKIDGSTGCIAIPCDFKFESIDLNISTGNVSVLASATELIKVKASTGDISVQNITTGNLELETSTGDISVNTVKCSENISISVSTGAVFLENITCKNLTSDGTTGSFTLNNLVAEENLTVVRDTGNTKITNADVNGYISLTASTGKTDMFAVRCASLTSVADTGKLYMSDVIASEDFDIKRDTGDITFEACDASELTIEASTGDVTGSLLSEKIFIVSASTGKIRVPESTNGGKCKITTSTGNITIDIKNA